MFCTFVSNTLGLATGFLTGVGGIGSGWHGNDVVGNSTVDAVVVDPAGGAVDDGATIDGVVVDGTSLPFFLSLPHAADPNTSAQQPRITTKRFTAASCHR